MAQQRQPRRPNTPRASPHSLQALRGLKPEEFEALESDLLFLLYSEGFATRAEHLVMRRETWRISPSSQWLEWCKANIGKLACECLNRVSKSLPLNDFYGS